MTPNILQGGHLDLNGTQLRVGKFAIDHQFSQCTGCLGFGHVKRHCFFTTRCLYCAETRLSNTSIYQTTIL